jgi:hypothetical protein
MQANNKTSELISELRVLLSKLRQENCPRKRGLMCNVVYSIVQEIIINEKGK